MTTIKPESAPNTTDTTSSKQITLTTDKLTLVLLCQNLNINLLVNITAYKNVLTKLKDNEPNDLNKTKLDNNIEQLNELEKNVSELLNNVQTNLDVPETNRVDLNKVIEDATGSSGSTNFMQKLLGAEAAAILSSMSAALVLMGGGRYNKKKNTKRKQQKYKKKTKTRH